MNNELLEKLRNDIKNGTRYSKLKAIDRLEELGGNKSFEILILALEDGDEEVAYRASTKFRGCSSKIQKKIISLFSHRRWKVRNLASDVIINCGNPSVSTLIDVLNKSEDTNVIFWIIKTLGKIEDGRAFTELKRIIEEGSEEEKIAAIESISSVKNRKTISTLIKTLVDENWHVRKRAAESLIEMGDIVISEVVKNIETEK